MLQKNWILRKPSANRSTSLWWSQPIGHYYNSICMHAWGDILCDASPAINRRVSMFCVSRLDAHISSISLIHHEDEIVFSFTAPFRWSFGVSTKVVYMTFVEASFFIKGCWRISQPVIVGTVRPSSNGNIVNNKCW